MNATDFSELLLASAGTLGWEAKVEPNYVARTFKGRQDDISPLPSGQAVGLQLGDYPVLVSTLQLEDRETLQARLKALHGQMVIARSFMRAEQIINAHIFLCATESGEGDWLSVRDIAERDEAVCRKLVWLPATTSLEQSYSAFLERTFMARPWDIGSTVLDAPLDHNQALVQRVLVKSGLTPALAEIWEEIVRDESDDPEVMVNKIVDAMEKAE
jgi:hypothetical protein